MSNEQLRAEVAALRERIATEKSAKARRDAAGSQEYRDEQLRNERDRLRVELAAVMNVDPASISTPEGVVVAEEVSGVPVVPVAVEPPAPAPANAVEPPAPAPANEGSTTVKPRSANAPAAPGAPA